MILGDGWEKIIKYDIFIYLTPYVPLSLRGVKGEGE